MCRLFPVVWAYSPKLDSTYFDVWGLAEANYAMASYFQGDQREQRRQSGDA